MQSFDHVFEEFPEGTWWIAWIDHVSSNGAQQRLIHVSLSRLPQGATSATSLRLQPGRTTVVSMAVANLPLFAVGDVIQNKRLARVDGTSSVKSVCDLTEGGEARSFTFDASTLAGSHGTRLGDKRSMRPPGYPAHLPCSVLTPTEYPFPGTRNCVCLVVTEGNWTYLVPAAELLRSLVMPFSDPLEKLFDKSLPEILDDMVVVPSSPLSQTGHFTLDLKKGYDGRHARFIANLMRGYNDLGHTAAFRLHWSLSRPDPGLTLTSSIAPGSSVLPCILPFGQGMVSFTAKCFVLRDGRFLVAKITGGCWPSLPPLEVRVLNSAVDPTMSVPPPTGPAPAGRLQDLRGNDPANVHLRGTPGYGNDPVDVVSETIHWEGQPPMIVRVRSHKPDAGGGRTIGLGPERRTGIAIGQARPGGNLAPASASRAAEPSVDRFQETIAVLKRLKKASKIVDATPFVPPDPRRSSTRGSVPVWIWPSRKSWHLLRSESAPDRRRSLLVIKVEVMVGCFVHWLSIEPSGTTSYSALLIAFEEPHAVEHVVTVVDEISKRSGKLGDAQGFAVNHRGRKGAKLSHAMMAAPTGTASAATGVGKQFNDARVLAVLEELCS